MTPVEILPAPRDEEQLEDRLSAPGAPVVAALRACPGDVLVLGAGGKLGPSLARMARRAADLAGSPRRVLAVSRFSDGSVRGKLDGAGIETIAADLADQAALRSLPDAPNVILLAGQKFGTTLEPARTWVANVVVPSLVADRFRDARIVALSTGNVYARMPGGSRGATERDAPAPAGEYAWSCLGRERVLEHAAQARRTPVAIVRLNYAVDLRYGVLVDLALRVANGQPIDLTTGWVNVIWQGDACARALCCLPLAAVPPFVINVTGPDSLSIREAAMALGARLGRAPILEGREGPDALLSDATLARERLGPPSVATATLIDWVAEWVARGGPTLGKPTQYQEREGAF